MKLFASLFFALFLLANTLFSQEYGTTNKKAIIAYEDAVKNFQYRYFAQAEESVVKALKIDPTFYDAYYLLAGIYSEQKQTEKVILTLERCVALCGEKEPWAYYKLAFEQADNGMFNEALTNLKVLKANTSSLSPKHINELNKLYNETNIALRFMEHPVPFNPINMGDAVNSEFDDYHPTITVDEEILIFTSLVPHPQARGNQEDLYYCRKGEDGWKKRIPIDRPINTPSNEGAQSISADGKRMILTICNAPGGFGSCDIYITEVKDGRWMQPQNLGPVINTSKWDSQPSLSADGRTLYFVSNREGGLGKKDIWMSTQNESGEWTPPVNMGEPINTPEEDESPYIHADGVTLYFSSDGHPGLGKKDMYKSTRLSANTWSQPQNLGYPINTHNRESYIIVNAQGNKAYFSSNRYGSNAGSMDLYEFDMPESIRPLPVTYITGTVFDAIQKSKKLEAQISLYELKSGDLIYRINSEKMDGSFIVPFVEGVEYALTISHQGYLFYSENVTLQSIGNKLSIPLQPMLIGGSVVLNNVFFDIDSDVLKPESKIELLTLINFMKQNPHISFEIGGHTDNTGTKQHNIELSTKRAKAVLSFLTSAGIDSQRLTFKGYADSKPLVANDTPENRAKNRRTELTITKQ